MASATMSGIYYLGDANFNVTTLVNTGGDAVERYVYSPYGVLTIYDATWANTRSASSYANVYTYTGRQLDTETGLFYYRARFLHAQLGRFCSRDPIGYADNVNLQSYVDGNSPSNVDYLGLAKCCVDEYEVPMNQQGIVVKDLFDYVRTPPIKIFLKYVGQSILDDFFMMATFREDDEGCCCYCCEYRQYIKGQVRVNGQPLDWPLPGGKKLSPDVFNEDGDPSTGAAYGHRLDGANADQDCYLRPKGDKDVRKHGCAFIAHDSPGIVRGKPGVHVIFDVTFKGEIQDVCNKDKDGNPEVKKSSEWSLQFEHTVPLHSSSLGVGR